MPETRSRRSPAVGAVLEIDRDLEPVASSAATRAPGFVRAPHPLLRVNPTPSATLRAGRASADADLLVRLECLGSHQRASADALGNQLYSEAPHVDHETRNDVVLPLRRAVHNQRLPRIDADRLGALQCAEEAKAWLVRQVRLEALRTEFLDGYEGALSEERDGLREVLRSRPLLSSLSLSSELLPAAAQHYADAPWAQLSKNTRKSEGSLLRYAVRAGSKTSPYSQYTAVGFLDENASCLTSLGTTSTVEVNRALLRRIEAGLLRTPTTGDRVWLHASAGLRRRGDQLVSRGDRDQLGAEAATIAEQYGEAQVTMPASPAVLALVNWLSQRDGGCATFGELTALIEAQVAGADARSARAFILRLVDCGVLAASPVVDENAPDALLALCDWIGDSRPEATERESHRRLHDGLVHLADAASRFADADPDARVDLLRDGRRQRDAVLVELGDDAASRPAPEPIWYEDSQLTDGAPGTVEDWSGILHECEDLLDILGVFDEQHVFSRVLTHRFVGRFGRGGTTQDLDTLGEIFLPAYGDALQVTEGFDHELINSDPVIGKLVGLRRRILDSLVPALRDAEPGAEPVELGREWIDVVARELPDWVRQSPASHSVFLQPLGGNPPAGAVLNKIYNGWGNYLSRFLTDAPAGVLTAVRANSRRHLPHDETVAELRAVQGFNANIHPLLGDVDLDHDARGRPDGISMSRLTLRHDPTTDRVQLWDTETGRRVHPFYLGFLIPYYLPSHLVPLTAMAGSGSVMFEPQVTADRTPSVDRDTVRHYPQVRFGSLVLARARWHVPALQFPRAEAGDTEADYFLRINEWRTTHGIPEHVFLHPPAPELDPGQVNEYFGSYMGNRKPQYVALLSRLHVRHLQRLIVKQPGVDVILEEALPSPAGAFPLEGARHAAELVAEFYRPAGLHTTDDTGEQT